MVIKMVNKILLVLLICGTTVSCAEKSKTFTVNGVSFRMIKVYGGTYTMGCTPEQENNCEDREYPAHSEIIVDFMIGETEVTQELWKAVMGEIPSGILLGEKFQWPATYISWDQCQKFISRLNRLTGQTFRIPTEAEWEYAARGGNKSHGYKYSGSNDVNEVAWYYDNSRNALQCVKTKKPNELGIYDMSGNVQEFCQDQFSFNYNETRYSALVVSRGGCSNSHANDVRVSKRSYAHPIYPILLGGLRLAL